MLVVAHRGNSPSTLRRFLKLPVHGVEIDVRICGKGICVRHGVLGGRGFLRFLDYVVSGLVNGDPFRPVSLERFLSMMDGRMLFVDMHDTGFEEELADILSTYEGDVFVTSPSIRSLRRLREADGRFKLGWSSCVLGESEVRTAVREGFDFVNGRYVYATRRVVELAKDYGLSVVVWTVNSFRDAVSMRRIGVDYLITDFPEEMVCLQSRA